MDDDTSILTLDLDDIDVTVRRKSCVDANILIVEAGTTCPCGGDSGHGGRTIFALEDEGGTDIEFNVMNNDKRIEIVLGGDAECDTLIEALEFAAAQLRQQKGENIDRYKAFVPPVPRYLRDTSSGELAEPGKALDPKPSECQ